ncbi:hypothetical protein [Pseudomonas violetae]|uniref:Uncharacterized protein n=1 Tax=Pseudomonas violetae TaxID=2915813 RepID=A0ABT0ET02_9PSED|nr:hypothetical protein [Pseudomonas violetae]MCK1788759.1 hypothetical protein [Pseudomonas violetae]
MKTSTDIMSRNQWYLMTFGRNATRWLMLSFISLAAAWYLSGIALVGIALGIGLPALLIKRSVDKRIAAANQVLEDVYNKTLSSLPKVDYYNYGADGSISVDAESGQISVIKILPTMEILAPFVFNATDIIEFHFYDPGMTTTKYYGRDIVTAQATLNDNLEAMADRLKVRGLHIRLNDIENPKIVVTMTAKEADHWILIIRKLINRSLAPVVNPKMVP